MTANTDKPEALDDSMGDSAPNAEKPDDAADGDEFWKRVAFTVGFGFAAYFALMILFFVSVAQAIFLLATKQQNDDLSKFGANLAVYLGELAAFLAWSSEDKPFPVRPFPSVSE